MTAPKRKQKEITRISASVLVQTFSSYGLLHDRPPKEGKQELSAPSFDFGSDLLWPSERVMLLSCVSRPFHLQNQEAQLTRSNLTMYVKSFLIGKVWGEIHSFQMSSRDFDSTREEERQKLFGPFSAGLCLCFTFPERTPEAAFGTKHFVQQLRRDTCRHGSLWLKVHGG